MLKVFSLKTISAVALSLSMLLGSLAIAPVTSVFAKASTDNSPWDGARRTSHGAITLDNDGDEMNESSELPLIVLPPLYNRRLDTQWTFKNGRG